MMRLREGEDDTARWECFVGPSASRHFCRPAPACGTGTQQRSVPLANQVSPSPMASPLAPMVVLVLLG